MAKSTTDTVADTTQTEEANKPAPQDTVWVVSNRVDDRVVLHERDARHPGGEAFIGGSGPDKVFRTPRVDAAIRAGLALVIPEPPEGRKKPLIDDPNAYFNPSDQPGQKTHLGRDLDPDLFEGGKVPAKVTAKQDDVEDIPVESGTEVPAPIPPSADTVRS